MSLLECSMGEPSTRIPVVVIGAGHAGLAMSRRLTERSIEHVVLERAEIANSWSTERWDSLRLLTPNWQSRLPGMRYEGNDPHGFMTVPEVVDFISAYAERIAAPVQPRTTVTSISAAEVGYAVETDKGSWTCEALVIASGGSNVAKVPAVASGVPDTVATVTPMTYRSPEHLDDRGVLIVGASATGVQLADEIHRSGRDVTVSVGEHVRLPRTYRERDVFWWMDAAGISDQRHTEMDDLVRARSLPSPQLTGAPQRRSIDLNSLTDRGVKIVGRLGRISDGRAQFAGSLANVCAMADLKMNRLLQAFDDWATASCLEINEPPQRFDPTRVPSTPSLGLHLGDGEVGTIVWATGYRPDYSWLHVPVLDRKGRLRHDGGIVEDAPGMYVIGLNMLRRRRSSFISGASDDSEEISNHLENYLAEPHSGRTVPDRRSVMETNGYIEVIAKEGRLFAAAAERSGLDIRIPSCPEWKMRDLVQHLGLIHLWAAAHVDQPHPEPGFGTDVGSLAIFWPDLAGSYPEDGELLDWYRKTNANLVRVLESTPSDRECFTFLPTSSPLSMWARRQASETAAHRFDAESAVGVMSGFDPVFASDALDELLSGFAPGRRVLPISGVRTMQVHAVDTDNHWLLTLGPEVTTTSRTNGTGDLTLTGAAVDLYLALWNRGDDSAISITGDGELLEVWRDNIQIRWGEDAK